jgi:hypothetical protein
LQDANSLLLENGFFPWFFRGGAYGKGVGESISQKVLLLLPRLCVKMSEVGANQMKKVLIKISTISTIKRKTGALSGGCKNA